MSVSVFDKVVYVKSMYNKGPIIQKLNDLEREKIR